MAFPNLVGAPGHNSVVPLPRNCRSMGPAWVVIGHRLLVPELCQRYDAHLPRFGDLEPRAEGAHGRGPGFRPTRPAQKLKAGVTVRELKPRGAGGHREGRGTGRTTPHSVGPPVGLNRPRLVGRHAGGPGRRLHDRARIYIPQGRSHGPPILGIWGVRIEDTYLVTRTAAKELTSFPKIPEK